MARRDERVGMSVAAQLERVRARIVASCDAVGRKPSEVKLVAVSKRHSTHSIRAAYDAGQRVFGENYVQEMVAKAAELRDLEGLQWRFVGHLQRNKAKDVVSVGATVDTVDRLRLARALQKQAAASDRRMEVLIQVNVGGEAQKHGCASEDAETLITEIQALDRLDLRGLMTVPPRERAQESFARLRQIGMRHQLPILSMGMSADLEMAIAEGATQVRVGTAIFGPRS